MQELKRIRKERGLTQRGLANISGVDPATISLLENGKRRPHLETLDSLAEALGVEVADLIPKAQAQLVLLDRTALAGRWRDLTINAEIVQKICEGIADRYEQLAEMDVPPSRALGWWDIAPYDTHVVLGVVDTLLEGVEEGWVYDDDNELIPLLREAWRLAHFADILWSKSVEALGEEIERASAETDFWRLTKNLNLSIKQREEITA